MMWTVTDPAGRKHIRNSATRVYTHAVIRQNKGSESYFVNWSTSEDKARAEARVLADRRSYIQIVELGKDQTNGGV